MTKDNIDHKGFLRLVFQLAENSERISLSVLGWKDWDYFKEFCDEDGGIDEEQLRILDLLPFSSSSISLEELKEVFYMFGKYPFLASKNGKYKFHYDFHLWTRRHYLIYNFNLKKAFVEKRTLLNRILFVVKTPDWQGER